MRGFLDLQLRYLGPLTAEQVTDAIARHEQMHLAPGEQGAMAYGFEVHGTEGPTKLYGTTFCVRANSPEAARQHAQRVFDQIGAGIEQQLGRMDAEVRA